MNPSAWRPLLFTVDGWLLTGTLAVLLPLLGYVLYRRLHLAPYPTPTRSKMGIYSLTASTEWILVLITIVVSRRHGLSPADLGLTIPSTAVTLVTTCAGLLALTALTAANTREIARATLDELEGAVRRARRFVPVGHVETTAFIGVALTAGFCEELLYRGWLVSFLGAGLGSIWAGVGAGGVVFGLAHGYQGRKGILATGILGIIFGALFAAVRSLVPGMLLHAGIDIVNGVLAGRIVRRVEREAGAAPEEVIGT